MSSTRPAECGHGGFMHAKGLCQKCYHAARYQEKREWIGPDSFRLNDNRSAA